MADLRTLVHEEMDRAGSPSYSFDDLGRRRDRKRRNQRLTAGVIAIIVALVSFAALIRTFSMVERPADEPTPPPTPEGIFADVGGWIAYGNTRGRQPPLGIWAVDPTRPNDPEARIQLSDRPGTPLAWSSDGSKLLIWREPGLLFVLNADGTETRLVTNSSMTVGVGPIARDISPGGSFSPDGSKVVFAADGGIYTVDADGGTPRLLAEGGGDPTFSPDGTKIAHFEFRGGPGHALRVMNADGTGDRVLLGSQAVDCYYPSTEIRPAWSPDGTHIAFVCDRYGIRVIGADGSGLRTVFRDGRIPGQGIIGRRNPHWSPDGSRIAFELGIGSGRKLAIADADGTHVEKFGPGARAGPWNPLPLSEAGETNPTATRGSGLATPLVYAIALVVLVGVLIGGRRARGKNASRR